jgi:transcriptional regulator with XRE-family HTH domain
MAPPITASLVAFTICSRKISDRISGREEGDMDIGQRLRSIREEKQLSQGDIEQRTGLLRCYISRVENGHTVPAIETLEKIARAMEIPLYELMYDGDEPPTLPNGANGAGEWGSKGKDARFLKRLCECLGKMSEIDRNFLLTFAEKMPRRKNKERRGPDA